jgi:outer membrane lipoprotein-sorting protein
MSKSQAERLAGYQQALADNPDAAPPADLDPGVASVAQRLMQTLRPPAPQPGFAERLARGPGGTGRGPRLRAGWSWRAVQAVASLLVAALGMALIGLYWRGLPARFVAIVTPQVTARSTLQATTQATTQATALVTAPATVQPALETPTRVLALFRTFVLTATMAYKDAGDSQWQPGGEIHHWYQGPGRWRREEIDTGKLPGPYYWFTLGDGIDVWSFDGPYNPAQQEMRRLSVYHWFLDRYPWFGEGLDRLYDRVAQNVEQDAGYTGVPPSSLDELLAELDRCYTPRLTGTDVVAGRSTYVIDLGLLACEHTWVSGYRMLWVDQGTLLALKQTVTDEAGNISQVEATQVQYDVPLDPALFTFMPPPDVPLQDARPRRPLGADEFNNQLLALAPKLPYSLYAPGDLPAGVWPTWPQVLDEETKATQIDFLQPWTYYDELESVGVRVYQMPATLENIAQWTRGARQVRLASEPGWGWLRAWAGEQAAYVVRGGTLIAVDSFTAGTPDLLRTVDSMRPVPGGHIPLPLASDWPAPRTTALDELRPQVSFAVFVPVNVAPGWSADAPVLYRATDSAGGLHEVVVLAYHDAQGQPAMTLLESDGGLSYNRLAFDRQIQLPGGVNVSTLDAGPGAPPTWAWKLLGTTVVLEGDALDEASMQPIASSLAVQWLPEVKPTP